MPEKPARPIHVEVEGGPRLRKALRNVESDFEDLKAANLDAAQIVEKQAFTEVPVRTGTLRDTIRSSGTKTKGVVKAGFARVPVAGPIHFGWKARNIEPQPFLYSALDKRRNEVFATYNKAVKQIIRKNRL